MIFFKNGDSFEGEIYNDNNVKILSGKGKIKYSNGSCYEGEILEGKFNGFGVLFVNNLGLKIEGSWKDNV